MSDLGTWMSRTSSVIANAKTPSLKASSRPVSQRSPTVPERQLHFDLVVSPKLLTELTTRPASAATAAICAAEGLDGSALMELSSVSTDDFTAVLSVGKSLLAEPASDVASLLIAVICDVRPL